MDAESKALFKSAVQQCLPTLAGLSATYKVPSQAWKKIREGQWAGETEIRTDLRRVFFTAQKEIEQAGRPFIESFFAHHPEYNGMVGLSGLISVNLAQDPTVILRSALDHLSRQHDTFKLDDAAVEALVGEFEEFVDKPAVHFLFRAQLLNFTTPADSIELPQGLRIRRMNNAEVSALRQSSMFGSLPFGVHEFCIEGQTQEGKVFGNINSDAKCPAEDVRLKLDRATLCLRTFKGGRVGYHWVQFFPVTFSPLRLGSYGYGDLHVPVGAYRLEQEEVGPLVEHAQLIFGLSEPAMEMACSRLADAETRTKPQDRLVDAVIGMEALLLAGLGAQDRRGELKFRFSLNYSTLFDTPEQRYEAFRNAKELYDLRSVIAHGGSPPKGVSVPDAAMRACQALRQLVRHFLPESKQAPYKKHPFWERAHFGLPRIEPAVPAT